jgi:hypothetical protein
MDRGAAENEFYLPESVFQILRFLKVRISCAIFVNINFIHSIGFLMIRLSVVSHRCSIYC